MYAHFRPDPESSRIGLNMSSPFEIRAPNVVRYASLPFSFFALFSLFFFFAFFFRLRTFRRYLLHPFFSRQNAFLRGIANIALDRRRTAPTKDTGNEVNAAAVFSVRNNDVRTSRSKLLAATAVKAARTHTLGHTY